MESHVLWKQMWGLICHRSRSPKIMLFSWNGSALDLYFAKFEDLYFFLTPNLSRYLQTDALKSREFRESKHTCKKKFIIYILPKYSFGWTNLKKKIVKSSNWLNGRNFHSKRLKIGQNGGFQLKFIKGSSSHASLGRRLKQKKPL